MMPMNYGQSAAMPQARPVAHPVDDMILVRYVRARRGQHSVVGSATKEFYGYRDYGDVFEIHRSDYDLASHWFQPVSMTTQEDISQPAVRLPQEISSELPPPPPSLRNIDAGDAEDVAIAEAPLPQPIPQTEETKTSLAQAVEAIMGTSRMAELAVPDKSDEPDLEPEAPALGMADSMLAISVGTLPGMTPMSTEWLNSMGIETVGQLVNWDLEMLQEIKGIGITKAQKIRGALDMMRGEQ